MFIELGHLAFILAMLLNFVQLGAGSIGYWQKTQALCLLSLRTSRMGLVLMSFALLALAHAYAVSDFSVRLVVVSSYSENPLFFKLGTLWATPQGALFLLLFFVQLVTCFFVWRSSLLSITTRGAVCAGQAFLQCVFFLLSFYWLNPFLRLFPAALQGQEVNPILQDKILTVHPPLIYLAYAGFFLCYTLVFVGVVQKNMEPLQALLRQFVRMSWSFLTLGIALGSFWAYYELGWGGYWSWDPVENSSLLLWLIATALLHALVQPKAQILTILLAVFSFWAVLFALFVTRASFLLSVHNFSQQPAVDIWFFCCLALLFICGIILLFLRLPYLFLKQEGGGAFLPNFFVYSCVVLCCLAGFTIFCSLCVPICGTFFTGRSFYLSESYFVISFVPVALLGLFVLPFVYRTKDKSVLLCLLVALIVLLYQFYYLPFHSVLCCVGVAVACFVILTYSGNFLLQLVLQRKFEPRSFVASLAHMGAGVMLLGMAGAGNFTQTQNSVFSVKATPIYFAGYYISLESEGEAFGTNFRAKTYDLLLKKQKFEKHILIKKRFYPLEKIEVVDVGLAYAGWLNQFYFTPLAEDDNKLSLELSYRPLILCIWLGVLLMITAMAGAFLLVRKN